VEKAGGINLDIRKSKRTLQSIKQFSKEKKLVYLPSHDPESASRLEQLKVLET
jgi:hypothetical protein